MTYIGNRLTNKIFFHNLDNKMIPSSNGGPYPLLVLPKTHPSTEMNGVSKMEASEKKGKPVMNTDTVCL